MDPDHMPVPTAPEPHASRAAQSTTVRPDEAPARLDPDDAPRPVPRGDDAGMPESEGFGEESPRVVREHAPRRSGAVLDEAQAHTVYLPYEFLFHRIVDLPPLIVWDALTDEDMVSGWLAEATIDPRVGGDFWFEWMTVPDRSLASASGGRITRFDEGRVLEYTFFIDDRPTAVFHFLLEDMPGGARGRQTGITLTVSGLLPSGIANTLKASWRLHLDLLQELVHGRPVDWDRCEEEHGPTWRRYLAELESAEG